MRHRFLTRPLSAVLLPLALALTLVGTLFAAATSGSPPVPTAAAAAHPDRGHPATPSIPATETAQQWCWCTARSPTPVAGRPLRRS